MRTITTTTTVYRLDELSEAARAFAASLAGGQEKHEEPTFDLDLMLGY